MPDTEGMQERAQQSLEDLTLHRAKNTQRLHAVAAQRPLTGDRIGRGVWSDKYEAATIRAERATGAVLGATLILNELLEAPEGFADWSAVADSYLDEHDPAETGRPHRTFQSLRAQYMEEM